MRIRSPGTTAHSQSGSSFIEIIISMFLISVILLGLDALQIVALRETNIAYYFGVATQQLHNISERLDAIKTSDVADQIAIWNKQNQELLPQGRGIVSGHYPNARVDVFWGNITGGSCETNKIGQSGCLHV